MQNYGIRCADCSKYLIISEGNTLILHSALCILHFIKYNMFLNGPRSKARELNPILNFCPHLSACNFSGKRV